ncbi:MAG TPA: cysteine desulfurase family protein [Longimicrobiales bacterium]|nr:cysteine desulfurase family protein [Longimicrobiales bacterium]
MEPIYLDFAATTPVREEVRAVMASCLADTFGNPSSIHRWGRVADDALEEARADVAAALGARPREILFVRGGTESDNLALLGWCRAQLDLGHTPTLAVSAVEHHAVLRAAESAEREGARVTTFAVSPAGALDVEAADRALANGPALASIMWVNNETGMLLPLPELLGLAGRRSALVHTDAAQAVGKVRVDVRDVAVDLLSATGHKIYGPKGTGLLFVREGTPLAPLLHGGGQERGLRPGTEDVAGAVGLATALRLAVAEQRAEAERLTGLRDHLAGLLKGSIEGVRINAVEATRAPHVLSVGFPGIEDGSALVMALDIEGVAVSGGSACSSGASQSSHVIRALYGADDRRATIRFSFGRGSDAAGVERAARAAADIVGKMREA